MSVLIETSAGELVVDLYVDDCPKACENFLKLCQIKYYNNCLIFQVQRNHLIQAGDPTATGKSGSSIWGLLKAAESGRGFFPDEIVPNLRFNKPGLLCMANQGPNTNTSQFFITLRDTDLEYLEEKHTIFGCVAEGLDTTLKAINETEMDLQGRPLFDIRLLHTHILDDPFPEPDGISNLVRDSTSHKPDEEQVEERIPYGTDLNDNGGKTEEQLEAERKEKETKARAQVLTILGDLPDADVKPPENVLFVCKLNPVTEDEDLELIFSRFGEIKSCEVIRDPKTGDSLQYAFIEFANEAQCQEAYLKMNNVLIDERRIKVDFSQSVSKLWNKWAIGSRQPQANSGSGMSQRSKLGITKSHNSFPLRDEPNNSSRRKDYGHHQSRHRSGRSKSRGTRSKRPYGSETKHRYQSSDRRVSSRSANRSNTSTGNKHSRRSSRERSTGRSRRRRSKSHKSSRKRTRSRSKMRRSK